ELTRRCIRCRGLPADSFYHTAANLRPVFIERFASVRLRARFISLGRKRRKMESPAIRLPPQRTTESRTNLVVIVPNELVRQRLHVILKPVACVATVHFCGDVWDGQHRVAVVGADMVLSYAGPGLSGEADEVFARMAAGGAKILSVLSWEAQIRVEALTDLVADGYLLDSEL